MRNRLIGIGILAIIILAAVLFSLFGGSGKPGVVVKGYVGGEKSGFFADQEVIAALKQKYGIEVNAIRAGSYEMLEENLDTIDFLFPSSQIALEIFKNTQAERIVKAENILLSPIIFYSWHDIAVRLVAEGIAAPVRDELYRADLDRLLGYMIPQPKKWQDIGIDLYGSIKISCTDPNKSNSGNMYAGLLYTMLQNRGISEPDTLGQLKALFDNLGYMESSSGTMFENYLLKGKGAHPIVVGYENQIVEFALENPDIWTNAKSQVAILIPVPTVWSEHPMIALSDNGNRLLIALRDKEILALAWKKHGFRYPAFTNPQNAVVTLPTSLDQIVDMPSVEVMEKIMQKLNS